MLTTRRVLVIALEVERESEREVAAANPAMPSVS